MSLEHPTDAELTQRIIERGQVVWVVFGIERHESGRVKILGIYTDQRAADDRVRILKSAEAYFEPSYAKVKLDCADAVLLAV
jgi:hypothetical protein